MTKIYKVSGMVCGGCAKSVCSAVIKIDGVTNALVDDEFTSVTVDFSGEADDMAVKNAVEEAGFDFIG